MDYPKIYILRMTVVSMQFLHRSLSTSNCFEILALAALYDCEEVYAEVISFVRGKFDEVWAVPEARSSIAHLSPELILKLLHSEALEVSCESQVLQVSITCKIPPVPKSHDCFSKD